jgi:hypothetical protein
MKAGDELGLHETFPHQAPATERRLEGPRRQAEKPGQGASA